MNNYSLEEIERYINEFSKREAKLIEFQDKIINIPFVGWNLYVKAERVKTHIELLRQDLAVVKSGTSERHEEIMKRLCQKVSLYEEKNNRTK